MSKKATNPSAVENSQTENDQAIVLLPNDSESSDRKTLDIDGKRPIDPSKIEVLETVDIDGDRPIATGAIQVRDTLRIDGRRPIASSNLQIEKIVNIAGQRPIAPNDTEDPDVLMGYID